MYPAEVETVIYLLDRVGEVAIIDVESARWGEVGRAIIVGKPDTDLDDAAVLAHCSAQLARCLPLQGSSMSYRTTQPAKSSNANFVSPTATETVPPDAA
ncbi:MAG: hypothetical protein ACJAR2_000795 [Ilumatobacter sp.]